MNSWEILYQATCCDLSVQSATESPIMSSISRPWFLKHSETPPFQMQNPGKWGMAQMAFGCLRFGTRSLIGGVCFNSCKILQDTIPETAMIIPFNSHYHIKKAFLSPYLSIIPVLSHVKPILIALCQYNVNIIPVLSHSIALG